MPIVDQMRIRKSVRCFTRRPIPQMLRESLLQTAMQSPTAGNQQLYSVIDVTKEELKRKLADSCDHQSFIAEAPWVLVWVADCQRWLDAYRFAGCEPRQPGPGDLMLAVTDTCIAAQSLVMLADSFGIGSCYIGDVMENCEKVRSLLHLPPHAFPCAMLVLGYPTDQQLARAKTPRFDQRFIVHENYYERLGPAALYDMITQKYGGGTDDFDYQRWIRSFCERKYQSAFSREMSRSVAEYLKDYQQS